MNSFIIRPFILALSLLTRIPVKTGVSGDLEWGRSSGYFPFCGYILGFIAALPFMLLSFFGNNTQLAIYAVNILGAFFFVAVLAWLTKMFHIDGFCDACDAFTSTASTKGDRLRIMKDPHSGTAANAYLSLLFIGKMLAVYFVIIYGQVYATERFLMIYREQLSQHMTLLKACRALAPLGFLVAIPVIARFAMLFLAAIGRYPREAGTGAIIVGKVPVVFLVVGFIWLVPFGFLIPLINLALAVLLSWFVLMYWKVKAGRLLGGVTGDILGACCETAELAAAFGLILPEMLM
ncbi:MAG: adenosylcobinamide-GDP ribazoletransferase [Victivallales bacterium]